MMGVQLRLSSETMRIALELVGRAHEANSVELIDEAEAYLGTTPETIGTSPITEGEDGVLSAAGMTAPPASLRSSKVMGMGLPAAREGAGAVVSREGAALGRQPSAVDLHAAAAADEGTASKGVTGQRGKEREPSRDSSEVLVTALARTPPPFPC